MCWDIFWQLAEVREDRFVAFGGTRTPTKADFRLPCGVAEHQGGKRWHQWLSKAWLQPTSMTLNAREPSRPRAPRGTCIFTALPFLPPLNTAPLTALQMRFPGALSPRQSAQRLRMSTSVSRKPDWRLLATFIDCLVRIGHVNWQIPSIISQWPWRQKFLQDAAQNTELPARCGLPRIRTEAHCGQRAHLDRHSGFLTAGHFSHTAKFCLPY